MNAKTQCHHQSSIFTENSGIKLAREIKFQGERFFCTTIIIIKKEKKTDEYRNMQPAKIIHFDVQ